MSDTNDIMFWVLNLITPLTSVMFVLFLCACGACIIITRKKIKFVSEEEFQETQRRNKQAQYIDIKVRDEIQNFQNEQKSSKDYRDNYHIYKSSSKFAKVSRFDNVMKLETRSKINPVSMQNSDAKDVKSKEESKDTKKEMKEVKEAPKISIKFNPLTSKLTIASDNKNMRAKNAVTEDNISKDKPKQKEQLKLEGMNIRASRDFRHIPNATKPHGKYSHLSKQ